MEINAQLHVRAILPRGKESPVPTENRVWVGPSVCLDCLGDDTNDQNVYMRCSEDFFISFFI
jgi:hypothetical protein